MPSHADTAVGMMDGAYFTSRKDILDFFNELLELNLTKIEQTASGAVACQLTEYIFPGSIPLKKVKWDAKNDYEYIQNYKLLQVAFTKHRVQRHVDVDRLIRGKYQDNLEFCQWMKAFFEQAGGAGRDDYDPVASRSAGKGGKKATDHFAKTAKNHNSKLLPTDRQQRQNLSSKSRPNAPTRKTVEPKGKKPLGQRIKSNRQVGDTKKDAAELMEKNSSLETRNEELELTLTAIEKERDFYFEKLRDIEVMLQDHEENAETSNAEDLIQNVFKVLYATSEDQVVLDGEGDILDDGIEPPYEEPEPPYEEPEPPIESEKADSYADRGDDLLNETFGNGANDTGDSLLT
eukprot:CAMPEP_0194359584 /NCGR_PEP_ID=MMETSP0174-20130528/6832_1 /TAXON_ID=216777 /ORGANISM="Proboscia alata, Strain PI-D3" /LENGTH=346 /DNA_ID=CAMNT_0039130551 /DNA_START=159 /DNA_END=1199 /DNA_ORIENTATION=+